MIKGVICDLDGAYFTKGKESFVASLIKNYSADEDVVKTLFYSSDLMADYKRGKIDDAKFWDQFIERAHIKAAKEELIKLLIEGYNRDEKIVNLIRSLRHNRFETIICSNNFPSRINGLEEKYHFLNDFSVRVFSYELGFLKLEGFHLYETVLKSSHLSAEEILLFDDGAENVAHSKAFGFATIHYENYVKFMEDFEKYGIKI